MKLDEIKERLMKMKALANAGVGNMAAMREALEAARDLLLPQCNGGTAFAKACGETVNKIMDALSAPPRNCDVGTAEEQIAMFNEFCNSEWRDSGNANCGNCPLWVSGTIGDNCQIRWAQMPYEAQEGGAK